MTTGTRAFLSLALLAALLALGGCNIISGVLNTAIPLAGAKLSFACIPEGTPVDTPDGPRPIEALRAGDQVIGFGGETVRILQKHSYAEDPDATEFLGVHLAGGARIDLCGRHRIDGVQARTLKAGSKVAGKKVLRIDRYRGVARSYDLLTEDRGYRIGGIPVDSMIEEMISAAR